MRNKHGKNAARSTANEGASAVPDEKYSIGMAPLEFTRQQLVGPKSAITEFARTHIYKNELAGLKLDRYDVVTMWWLNARKVDSPLFHKFWARRVNGSEYKDETQDFWRVKRAVSREEKKRYPYCFFMQNENVVLLVPRILGFAIQYITFKDMVRWVLEANLDQAIERSDMVSLWDAITYIIYHFESSANKEKKTHESDETSSSILEYEQLVDEVRNAAKADEGLAQDHKRTHRDSDSEDRAKLENVNDELFGKLKLQHIDL